MRPGILFALLWPLALMAAPPLGQPLPRLTLSGADGGRLDGRPWRSDELTGKVHILFYVDPDARGDNPELEHALRAQGFPLDRFQSVAVINMAATWLPDFVLEGLLDEKQKAYPRTLYIKDLRKRLVALWGLDDDSYDVLLLDRGGRVLAYHHGPLNAEARKALIARTWRAIGR